MSQVVILIAFQFILILTANAHLLPEDSTDDNAEQLYREKRQDFLSNILKTIPFFNLSPTQPELRDDDDPNDIDDDDFFAPPEPIPSSISSLGTSFTVNTALHSSTVLSATIVPSATVFSFSSVSLSQITRTPSLTLASSYMTSAALTLQTPQSTVTSIMSVHSINKTSSVKIEPTSSIKPELSPSSFVYPTASSAVKSMSPSMQILPTAVKTVEASSSVQEEIPPVIKMMIMSAEDSLRNPKIPDETGFGESVRTSSEEQEDELKNIRYLYSNILIPVMSGLFGAMLITFGIIVYRCVRRNKLKRVRYYGGKPDSALYRLDQMSLLAEISSDEED